MGQKTFDLISALLELVIKLVLQNLLINTIQLFFSISDYKLNLMTKFVKALLNMKIASNA